MTIEGLSRLLCVGQDAILVQTRCAVLEFSGYEVESCLPDEVASRLMVSHYDAIIVSALLGEEAYTQAMAAIGSTPALILNTYMSAQELLAHVETTLKRAGALKMKD